MIGSKGHFMHQIVRILSGPAQLMSRLGPLPSFGQFVADRWLCDGGHPAQERRRAWNLAEAFIFDGKQDEQQLDQSLSDWTLPSSGTSLNPVEGGGKVFQRLDICPSDKSVDVSASSRSSQPLSQTSPLLDILRDLAADYFGHNWDRADELIQVNRTRLDAWKERKLRKAIARRTPSVADLGRFISKYSSGSSSQPVRSSASSDEEGTHSQIVEALECEIGSSPAIMLPSLKPQPPEVINANRPRTEARKNGGIVEVSEASIDLLLEGESGGAVEEGRSGQVPGLYEASIVLLEVYTTHCAQCQLLATKLRQLSEHFRKDTRILIVCVNGPNNPAFLERLDVQFYPTLKIIDRTVQMVLDWPLTAPLTIADMTAVLKDCLDCSQDASGTHLRRLSSTPKPVVAENLLAMLAEIPADDHPPSLEEVRLLKDASAACPNNLASRRKWISAMEIFRQLGCVDEESCRSMTRARGDHPPHLMMMGGGMGSGKSFLKRMVTQSEFWRRYGREVVQVEADHFKAIDPVYQLLTKAKCRRASERVHAYSTQAAEELFLSALKFRRDILFDSTLAWEPFLRQTLHMVRDSRHSYRRGPGYIESKDGLVKERYWEMEREVSIEEQAAAPYRVELIGVFVRPEVAVRRALLRQLLTGRGVPIKEQLKSHALFARNFRTFAKGFDTVILYDNNSSFDRGEMLAPREIARKDVTQEEVTILDEQAFADFERVSDLDVNACSMEELYSLKQQGGRESPSPVRPR